LVAACLICVSLHVGLQGLFALFLGRLLCFVASSVRWFLCALYQMAANPRLAIIAWGANVTFTGWCIPQDGH
jgi:ABC-type Co2+ transport system permease subunit